MIDILSWIDWKKFTVNAIIAYMVSWGYFFLSMVFVRRVLGKVNGVIVNYFISWGIMILAFYVLTKINPVGDKMPIL
jgi:hypothetical protein